MNVRTRFCALIVASGGLFVGGALAGQITVGRSRPADVAKLKPGLFRVRGNRLPPELVQRRMIPPTAPLTTRQKLSVLEDLKLADARLGRSFTLTPAVPRIAEKGYVRFLQAIVAGPDWFDGSGSAYFGPQETFSRGLSSDDRGIIVFFAAEAGKRYLLDVRTGGGDFWVRAWPGVGLQQTFQDTDHLVMVYQPDANNIPGAITVAGSRGGSNWTFYGVEITPLD